MLGSVKVTDHMDSVKQGIQQNLCMVSVKPLMYVVNNRKRPKENSHLTTVNTKNPSRDKLPAPLGEILINLTERLNDATS